MIRNLFSIGRVIGKTLSRNAFINQRPIIYRQFSTNWPPEITSFLEKENITKPTSIQEKTFEAAVNNKDLVGIARTGSGKTLAFVIPAVVKILETRKAQNESDGRSKKLTCLVLEPTRELANQTADTFRKFKHLGINSIVLVGGSSRSFQVDNLMHNQYDVCIATPGRLNDLKDSDLIDLTEVKYLVLDEADRMLDMGFEPQVRQILSVIPKDRQTLLWSATWPQEIKELAEDFMKDYEHIAVDSAKLKANPNIEQKIEICKGLEKFGLLIDHLQAFKETHEKPRVLIFANTKRRADQLIVQLMRNRFRAVSMHGDKSQNQRDKALRLFKDKFCDIMVATDVAARGLDINDITHVINYDLPTSIEDYIHRIGRTARHEKTGQSISLFTADDSGMARNLIKVLEETNQVVPDELKEFATSSSSSKSRPKNNRFQSSYYGNSRSFDRGERDYNSGGRFNDRDYNSGDRYSDRGYRGGGGGNRDSAYEGGRVPNRNSLLFGD